MAPSILPSINFQLSVSIVLNMPGLARKPFLIYHSVLHEEQTIGKCKANQKAAS